MRPAALLLMSLLGAGMAQTARAESPQDAVFAARVIGKPAGKGAASACFVRAYAADHLAQHPRQNVRQMRMLVTTRVEEDGNRGYELRLHAQFRASGQIYETQGSCGSLHAEGDASDPSAQAHCGVDCDGGAIDVALRGDNSILVSIPEGARLWRAGSNGDDETAPSAGHGFGADDKVFRLDRAGMSQCLSMAGNAKDRKSLGLGR